MFGIFKEEQEVSKESKPEWMGDEATKIPAAISKALQVVGEGFVFTS